MLNIFIYYTVLNLDKLKLKEPEKYIYTKNIFLVI